MKDTHEMTRLELENEVDASRQIIEGLRATIEKQKFVIDTYGDYIDKITYGEGRKRVLRKED